MTPAEFLARTDGIAFQDRGMFFSEVYLFASACSEAGVTQIIESGVCRGVSTRLLHALWPGKVISIEADPARMTPNFPIPVVIGDGAVMVPHFVERFRDETVGLLLDGPKNKRARALRDQCFAAAPHVKVVGIHDEPRGQGEDRHSLDRDWIDAMRGLDERVPTATRRKYPAGAPGLAVWVRR